MALRNKDRVRVMAIGALEESRVPDTFIGDTELLTRTQPADS